MGTNFIIRWKIKDGILEGETGTIPMQTTDAPKEILTKAIANYKDSKDFPHNIPAVLKGKGYYCKELNHIAYEIGD